MRKPVVGKKFSVAFVLSELELAECETAEGAPKRERMERDCWQLARG